jgi:hypothetical protein
MRKLWLTRLNTLILALLLAGGGSGLPVADALFHYLHGLAPEANRIGSGETPASHGERCTLGVPLPAMATAAAVAAAPRSTAASLAAMPVRGAESPRSSALPGATRPRAPPALIG